MGELAGMSLLSSVDLGELEGRVLELEGMVGELEGMSLLSSVDLGELEGRVLELEGMVGELEGMSLLSSVDLGELEGMVFKLEGMVFKLEGMVDSVSDNAGELEGMVFPLAGIFSELEGRLEIFGMSFFPSVDLEELAGILFLLAGSSSSNRKSNLTGRSETPVSIGDVATSAGVSSLFPAGITHRNTPRRGKIAANSSSFPRSRTAVSNDSIPAVSFPARNASRKTVGETPSGRRRCFVTLKK